MDYLMYYGMSHNAFDKAAEKVIQTVDYKELSFRLNYLTATLGLGLVTGRSGVGKTVILRDFTERLDINKYYVSYLPLSTVSVSDFYNQMAVSIGVEPAYRKAMKFRQLQERITEMHDIERITPIFIIDEAQYLSGAIFNELMLITNFGMDAQKKCLIILAGLPILAQTLQRPQFEAFRQRLTVSYQVIGLEPGEAQNYVNEKFKSAGVETKVISDEALSTIVKNAGGSTRRLDLIITECLILGAKRKQKIIDNETVFAANNELSLI
jgi:type II secretory pathway predicted ATPase ExeA